ASASVERESGLLAFVRLGRAFPPALPTLARVRLQRLSSIGNRRNPPPRAENAANFFRSSARASAPNTYLPLWDRLSRCHPGRRHRRHCCADVTVYRPVLVLVEFLPDYSILNCVWHCPGAPNQWVADLQFRPQP